MREILPLAAIVFAAFAVEATLGFGATVVTVALGAFLVPVKELLPVFVPVNICLSIVIATRHRRQIDRPLLLGRILPLLALGMPAGMLLVRFADARILTALFGVCVVALSAPQLVDSFRAVARERRPLPAATRALLLLAGGVVHGAFSTAGPLVVYVADRAGLDKSRFRATLSALWLVTGLLLVASFAAAGTLTAASARRSLLLVPAMLCGLAVGEWLHPRVDPRWFRRGVLVVLVAAGVALVARSL